MCCNLTRCSADSDYTHLDTVFDLPCVVANDERWLHDCRKLDIAVPLVLPLKLIQQGLVSRLGEARKGRKSD